MYKSPVQLSQHQRALLTWLVVYPAITAITLLLDPILKELALPLRTLVLSGLLVPLMVYLLMPWATRLATEAVEAQVTN